MSGGTDGDDQEDILAKFIFDEAFVKAAAVKEESARTRELRAQWKKEPPKSEPWRGWVAGPPSNYDGRRSPQPGSADDPYVTRKRNPRRGHRRTVRRTIALTIVLAMVAGIYSFYARRRIVPASVPAGISPTLTAMPTVTSAQVAATPPGSCFPTEPGCGSMTAPYVGSPAAVWADGAAGIVLPAAVAAGDFSASQVQSALALAKQFAVDQTLIPAVLDQGATPSAMLSLLTPSSDFSGKVVSEIAVATQTDNPTNVFVRFNPKTAVLLTTPKVSGTVTYSQVQAGTLQVDVSLKIAYALKKPDGSAWTRIVATLSDELEFFDGDGLYASAPGTVWPYLVGLTDYAGVECGFTSGFLEPQYLTAGGGNQPVSGAPVDPYATATSAPTPTATPTIGGCEPLSRI